MQDQPWFWCPGCDERQNLVSAIIFTECWKTLHVYIIKLLEIIQYLTMMVHDMSTSNIHGVNIMIPTDNYRVN
jgi:multisubunit Na+/H+ antiporter MnhE subunit